MDKIEETREFLQKVGIKTEIKVQTDQIKTEVIKEDLHYHLHLQNLRCHLYSRLKSKENENLQLHMIGGRQ